MPREVYEVVAQGARYWFLFLMVVIAWRSYRWLAKDRKQRKKRLKLLPDAGYIGEFVLQNDQEEMRQGTALLVPREGVLGYYRGCDLCLPLEGVAKKHLWFRFEDGEGLMVKPFAGHRAQADGVELATKRKNIYLGHGSRLCVGEATLRLRMFAGFETAIRSMAEADRAATTDREPEEEQSVAIPAAMTPEQLALWQAQQALMQQQYWLMAQQAAQGMYGQARQAAQDSLEDEDFPEENALAQEEEDSLDGFADMDVHQSDAAISRAAEETQGYVVLTDSGAVAQSPGKSSRSRRFNPFALAAEEAEQAAQETVFASEGVFYPPVQEESGAEDQDVWPYAEYPYLESAQAQSEDEDLTDAAAPPKSLYLEPDEAERAKRLLWDKYFGGGHKR